jgi:hypothetical protein
LAAAQPLIETKKRTICFSPPAHAGPSVRGRVGEVEGIAELSRGEGVTLHYGVVRTRRDDDCEGNKSSGPGRWQGASRHASGSDVTVGKDRTLPVRRAVQGRVDTRSDKFV